MSVTTLYMVTNKVNEKSYIGQTTQKLARRWYLHIWKAKHACQQRFHKAILKYGEHNFEVKALVIGQQHWIKELEISAIRAYNTFNNGYNDTKGGDGGLGSKCRLGKKHTAETRAKISAARKGVPTRLGQKNSAEHNEKVRQANLGKKASPETRSLLSAIRKATPACWMLGRKASPETKAKMSAAHKAKWAMRRQENDRT